MHSNAVAAQHRKSPTGWIKGREAKSTGDSGITFYNNYNQILSKSNEVDLVNYPQCFIHPTHQYKKNPDEMKPPVSAQNWTFGTTTLHE